MISDHTFNITWRNPHDTTLSVVIRADNYYATQQLSKHQNYYIQRIQAEIGDDVALLVAAMCHTVLITDDPERRSIYGDIYVLPFEKDGCVDPSQSMLALPSDYALFLTRRVWTLGRIRYSEENAVCQAFASTKGLLRSPNVPEIYSDHAEAQAYTWEEWFRDIRIDGKRPVGVHLDDLSDHGSREARQKAIVYAPDMIDSLFYLNNPQSF